MNKVYTVKDIEDIEHNGGNYDSLPKNAILTPSARDLMSLNKRKHSATGTKASNTTTASSVSKAGSTGKVPIHDAKIPDYEYKWETGKDARTAEEIQRFFYSPEITLLKERICDMGRRMWSKNYVDGNGGNITIRVGDNLALCTPTLISKGFMKVDDICLVDLDANQLAGKRVRTSEAKTHFAIMKRTPKAKACVHAHPPYATAFAVGGIQPPTCLIPEAEVFLGKVGMARYETPGTPENAVAVGSAAIHHQSVLMENHGVICWGKDVEDAYWKMENTESYCLTVLTAKQLGADLTRGYGPEKLRELIKLRQSLGMEDYRANLPDSQLCDNDPELWGGCAGATNSNKPCPAPSSCSVNADTEKLIKLITDRIMAKM